MSTSVAFGMETQKMIDYRLDTLDRLLISSGMNRAERIDVVQSVEDQIHELVDRRSGGDPSREDVVQVLGELDPPEAYVSDWSNLAGDDHLPVAAVNQPIPSVRKHSALGIASFVLALLSILFMILLPLGTIIGFAAYVCSTICLANSRKNQNLIWMPITANCIFAFHAFACLALVFMVG